jgi:hypothetical protein
MFQRQPVPSVDVAPAVRLAREKRDAIFRFRRQFNAEVRRQRRQRQFVDRVMAFVIPGACWKATRANCAKARTPPSLQKKL